MTELAVITPTYREDAEIFADLHRSVLEFTPPDTVHHVVVPSRDKGMFDGYAGARCRIWTVSELLPARYLHVRAGRLEAFVNARRPWLPARGWIIQQAVKIAAAAQLDAQTVLLADSDVVLVRPVRAQRFAIDGQPLLFREEKGVTADMDRHLIWHQVARKLFGLLPAPPPPLPDYISPFNFWDPAVVRALQERIHHTTGRHWLDAFTTQLHISEFILYGVFVDEVLHATGPRPPADSTVCHNTWDRQPLDHEAAIAFAERLGPDAVAMMISAKSRTPANIRRIAIERCAEIV
ncbi:hypothetical protein GA0070624_4914 [Micromonospora rhizosphaerae]|uniref:Uncharacterized protein n=1 Tax=Micromonospora rhizosphaerae TaxID=568872 RepID=A0A1C6SX57_9ACTN|nr:DUF6492 family protein [Micromonospora rhizosphaerae]SCL34146.1 hypothetical protein GA0070624_4914 [Micromonospora rhizosphaerae]